jgi:hypothetical protein
MDKAKELGVKILEGPYGPIFQDANEKNIEKLKEELLDALNIGIYPVKERRNKMFDKAGRGPLSEITIKTELEGRDDEYEERDEVGLRDEKEKRQKEIELELRKEEEKQRIENKKKQEEISRAMYVIAVHLSNLMEIKNRADVKGVPDKDAVPMKSFEIILDSGIYKNGRLSAGVQTAIYMAEKFNDKVISLAEEGNLDIGKKNRNVNKIFGDPEILNNIIIYNEKLNSVDPNIYLMNINYYNEERTKLLNLVNGNRVNGVWDNLNKVELHEEGETDIYVEAEKQKVIDENSKTIGEDEYKEEMEHILKLPFV